MRIIKRLYWFVLKSFLPLFAMTFFIVLFIVLMQFLWKYIDDLVGKGLSMDVLGELFFYAAVSMVPMALPLAILLASLMTFGNLGEKSELTAIKASGVSLLQVMKPLIILVACISVGAFFFQNDILPKAQVKMWTLLFSMKQKSPEVEIPEGVFYDQIPGYNLYVKDKNRDTGILYDVMIYDVSKGGDNATILLADSARLAFTKDSRFLYLHLFTGEQFENLREQRALDRNVPFRRETFFDKEVLIPFDANFNRLDEGGMRKQYVGKNIEELQATIDSLTVRVDSIGRWYAGELRQSAFPILLSGQSRNSFPSYAGETSSPTGTSSREEKLSQNNSGNKSGSASGRVKEEVPAVVPLNVDSLISSLTPVEQSDIIRLARNFNESRKGENQFRAQVMRDETKTIRRHEIELIKKFTLSVACLIFFFIGAPLGAIIRKGGLGTPLVISVLLFLVYY
ncbi:MAG: LptF/LptG family permease, partial [Muribaculaceae bacterium]|nr:LptF/LptG family permease [Muribaculaceae bacterium]